MYVFWLNSWLIEKVFLFLRAELIIYLKQKGASLRKVVFKLT